MDPTPVSSLSAAKLCGQPRRSVDDIDLTQRHADQQRSGLQPGTNDRPTGHVTLLAPVCPTTTTPVAGNGLSPLHTTIRQRPPLD